MLILMLLRILVSCCRSLVGDSEIREVPNNQEVFIDMETDQSLIIELLEIPEHDDDDDEQVSSSSSEMARYVKV